MLIIKKLNIWKTFISFSQVNCMLQPANNLGLNLIMNLSIVNYYNQTVQNAKRNQGIQVFDENYINIYNSIEIPRCISSLIKCRFIMHKNTWSIIQVISLQTTPLDNYI